MIKLSSDFIQIGLWQTQEKLELVWLDEQRQPHVLFCALPHLSTLDQCVRANLAQHKLQRRKHYFVAAISPHQIWSKTILFPHPLSESECEAQCGLLLTQELPITLSQLWFDYCAEQRQQGFRLTVFALQRSIAEQYLAPLSHVDVRVLDNVVYALLRAFQFLLPDANYSKTLLLYQDTQGCIAMQKRDHQVVYIQQAMADLNSTYTQFCQRYPTEIESVVVYQTERISALLPTDWTMLQTEVPLIALGNALWHGKSD
ncbi:hypothetical protein PMCNE_10800 [Pasteurella multocida]|uniref:pilus assembly protein PilM n=1 Tax=Pasteurella multocida TaxID=747 RepID=UPI0007EC9438|nr:pilus assembly protein PilM [Pasteurella multocida]MCL7822072.1 pilus assembly protein PilM [Pasteurella multocida]OBP34025.1 competence protein ComA [Pasteurella multocida subsp. multocida]TAA85083.1 hypothetical protein PMCNE_10800 [Pasteurella multocida]URH98334.1 pilus assembly protein PilM [Pasteurella multocida]URJ92797.1 pilus assembly protein PilM [Pasteurella multocida]